MKQYKSFMVLVTISLLVAMSMMALPCNANEKVQIAAKTALTNLTTRSLGKLYKVRDLTETSAERETVLKACVAGLHAIGDVKNAAKVAGQLNGDDFLSLFTTECSGCNGEGSTQTPCSKCKGTGGCQNRKCNKGMVTHPRMDGREYEEKCSICGGSGKCTSCKGTGNVTKVCNRCKGSKRTINKKSAMTSCQAWLKILSISDEETRTREMEKENSRIARLFLKSEQSGAARGTEGGQAGTAKRCREQPGAQDEDRKRKYAEVLISQGLAANSSGKHRTFQQYKFDFEEYRQWKNEDATVVQKQRIIQRLFLNGFKSSFLKEWVRCYFALVPDGLSFVVSNITEQDGHMGYNVLLKLVKMNSGGDEDYLAKMLEERLCFSSYVRLIIPAYDKDVETWKKGKIIVSKGWVYEVCILDAVVTYGNGAKVPDQRITTSNGGYVQVFRSMDERFAIETEAQVRDVVRAFQMRNDTNKGSSSSSFDSRSSANTPVQDHSSGTRPEELAPMWKCRYCGHVVPGSTPPSISTCLQHRENGGFGPCVFDKVR